MWTVLSVSFSFYHISGHSVSSTETESSGPSGQVYWVPPYVCIVTISSRFLSLGPWAVTLALSVVIFPYVLKLLQNSARELRPLLAFTWAKKLSFDVSCQAALVRDQSHKYFLRVRQLSWKWIKMNKLIMWPGPYRVWPTRWGPPSCWPRWWRATGRGRSSCCTPTS